MTVDLDGLREKYPWLQGSDGPTLPAPEAEPLLTVPTLRELEVLQLAADGLLNREIAERLVLSDETIKSHLRHVYAKLGATGRAHAVAIGFRQGMVS